MSVVLFLLGLIIAAVAVLHFIGYSWKKTIQNPVFFIITLGLLVRVAASALPIYFESDMACFTGWAGLLFDKGLSNFYISEMFTDYPPGYMYILFLVGGVLDSFGIDPSSFAGFLVTKLPAMLCDLALGVFIFKLAEKRTSKPTATVLSFLYIFNPAVILISACWGQVDAVHTLIIVLSLYAVLEKKLLRASLLFVLAVLVKPQAFMFTPLYMFAYFMYWKERKFKPAALLTLAEYLLACILMLVLLLLPFSPFENWRFNLSPVLQQYIDTLASYPHVTVNAYNIYALFGLNWKSTSLLFLGIPYSVWGTVALVLIVAAAFWFLYRANPESKSKLFYAAVLINFSTFMFSVKMHERYSFPILALLLVAFVLKGDKRMKQLYLAASFAFFLNFADVLRLAMAGFDYELTKYTTPLFAIAAIAAFALVVLYAVIAYGRNDPDEKLKDEKQSQTLPERIGYTFANDKSDEPVKYNWKDFAVLGAITLIYAAVAFANLGDAKVPESGVWLEKDQQITIRFEENRLPSFMQYYLGARHDKSFTLEISANGRTWSPATSFKATSVFKWGGESVVPAGVSPLYEGCYIRLTFPEGETHMLEFAFSDAEGNLLTPAEITTGAEALFDEQALVSDNATYRNGTYFDEIYHARTAYEFVNGLGIYEWTHPPLGKLFIAAGVKAFGMNPLGWRFVGTLFGVLMLPMLYIFARRMFKSTFFAGFATVLLAADFMHFAQTRIATIDTYITFFVIAMYFFMYKYFTMSFYDKPLWKTLVPLALSGLCMGLGIACKWPGMYAGLGLAVLFFITLGKRYAEYARAKDTAKAAKKSFDTNPTAVFPRYALITCLACVGFFVLVPALIYVLSYIPHYFGTNSLYPVREANRLFAELPVFAKLLPDSTIGNFLAGIIQNQRDIFNYHSTLVSEHPYSSTWWTWILNIRPIFYFAFGHAPDNVIKEGISSFGNPLVWWSGFAAIVALVIAFFRKYDKTTLFLFLAYLAQLLPWVFVSRTTYIYHYFPCVPFVILFLTHAAKTLCGESKTRRYAAMGFAAACVAVFALFYPVLSGMPIQASFVQTILQWLPSWQLI